MSASVATDYTFAFVTRSLPADASRILEIGCGDGDLAAVLASSGLQVHAVDSDAAAVAAASARGVYATLAEWPAELGEQFDTILFTRSLHHIHDLDGAVEAALRHLRPDGRILVEDFRAEGAGQVSGRWFIGLAEVLAAAGVLPDDFDAASKLATEHELHPSSTIGAALSRTGTIEEQEAAYYFRYFEPFVPQAASERLLAHELDLIAAGILEPLGKRFIVRPQ